MITALHNILQALLGLYVWVLILAAAYSLLTAFGVLDTRNRLVWSVGDFLYRITEPVLRPIRNVLPNLGGVDISPIIVILVITYLLRPMLAAVYSGIAYGNWQPVFL